MQDYTYSVFSVAAIVIHLIFNFDLLAGLGWLRPLYVETAFFFLSLVAFVFMWCRFAVAYLATSDVHWREFYEKYIDEALDKTLLIVGENQKAFARKMPCYSIYQANVSLELINSYETNAVRRAKIFASMRGFAKVAAARAEPCLKRPDVKHYGMCWDGELALTQLLAPGSPCLDSFRPFLELTLRRSDPNRWGVCRSAHVMAAYWRARRLRLFVERPSKP